MTGHDLALNFHEATLPGSLDVWRGICSCGAWTRADYLLPLEGEPGPIVAAHATHVAEATTEAEVDW